MSSANVVGYYDVEAPTGDSMRCPVFTTVGSSGYDLTKVVVTGGYGMGDIVAQTIGSDGIWNGEFYWLTEDVAGVPTGWYKDPFGGEPVEAEEVVLTDGQAFYIHSEYEDLALTVSGEVAEGDVDLSFAQGDGMVGNAVPDDTDFADVTVTGGYGMGDIVAQAIGADGIWNGEYYWLTEEVAGVPTGWYKDPFGGEPVVAEEIVLAPGESLYLHSEYEDLTVTLPAVLTAE